MKEEYSQQHRRWYDKDPVLSEAVRTLEETDDQTQIRVALNLIKIIIVFFNFINYHFSHFFSDNFLSIFWTR
mgnify:CR=1 FL=1